MKILVYGYGNPGRSDDGLGVSLSEEISKLKLPSVETDSNYQLNLEDSANISDKDIVVFVDASKDESLKDFKFEKIKAAKEITFTTHSMNPASVLALCEEVYKKMPEAYILAIRGYDWDFKEGLSTEAEKNFKKAFEFLIFFLKKQNL